MAGGLLAVLAKSCILYGPLVKRLRHGPFTAVTWVRFPYGSPKHPALKGAGCFSLYPSGLGRRTGIEQLVPAVCSGGSPKQAPRRGQDPALRVPRTKIQIPETGKGREDSRPFLRVSSVPSLQRRNKKAVQVLDGLPNKNCPRKKRGHFLWWAIQDLNPGPSGYEPPALTN